MFMICYGNVVDGLTFVGPFMDHDSAVAYCEGDDSQWNIIPLSSPPAEFSADATVSSGFSPEDIQSLRSTWTIEQCQDFLDENRKYIEDAMVEAGWESIESLLPSENDEPPPLFMGRFLIGQRVQVIEGTEDGFDDWAIGKFGFIREFTNDGYFEVQLDNHGEETYLFGEYQLTEVRS
jgi:hypothetical protein